MAKQLTCQRFIYKLHSSRLRNAKWNLTLPLSEARKNDEIVSLADSQILRWLDELNGIEGADDIARSMQRDIRRLRKEPSSVQNRKKIKKLYAELDEVQFKPDYMCVIMDNKSDCFRTAEGFTVNGLTYHRLLGTNGGIKLSTIVFIADRHGDEIRRRIENGRRPDKALVPAKLEAYKALTCSASIPVSFPDGLIIVNDCETDFISSVIYLNDECDGEPEMELRNNVKCHLDESDGYGIMLPSLAEKWGYEVGLEYIPSGVNTRFSFEKGMVFCFDFIDFAIKEAGSFIIKDAWGVERDVREAELILTTSMVKLWDSYESCEDYIENCMANHYTFGIAKTTPKELENSRSLNYQFIQSYDLSDEDIDELIQPTMDEIEDIISEDRRKTILFLNGVNVTDENVDRIPNGPAKAIMVDPLVMNDPYIRSNIFHTIKNRIDRAKIGVLDVHGNFSIICGDPYSLCQSLFGLEVTGILSAGQIYNGYWDACGGENLVCFRAPMTTHENIRHVSVCKTDRARYWYQHMTMCTIMNSWDTACDALNGADKDGDLVFLTDNPVLVRRHRELPALQCVQRKAKKIIPTDADLLQADINGFGDEIGKITNRITSMFEVQSRFSPDSEEYKMLRYRIQCGQLYQQNSIDKAKGIIAKPMPKTWYDKHSIAQMEDESEREFYYSIAADRKPYFMRYIYPDLMARYNKYIKDTNKKCLRLFGKEVKVLLASGDRTEDEENFIHYYLAYMPVGIGDCVMNCICRKFEERFDGYLKRKREEIDFDYSILKSGVKYSTAARKKIEGLYSDYNARLRSYRIYAETARVDEDDMSVHMIEMKNEFRSDCDKVCPNSRELCEIILDISYKSSATKKFAWSMCSEEIMNNLLERNDGYISYMQMDPDGDVYFSGNKFTEVRKKVITSGDNFEREDVG